MNEENVSTYEIDFTYLLLMLLKKWWLIVVSAVVCGAIAFIYTVFFITPKYTASVLMYVNNSSISVGSSSISISNAEITAAKTLVNTYRIILTSRLTLEEVIDEADLDYSYETLKNMISSQAVNDTEIFSIEVTSTNPEEACKIANSITYVLPNKIADVVEGSSVKTVDLAVVPVTKSSPNTTKNAMTGVLIGAVLCIFLLVIVDIANDSIRNETWLTETFGEQIPVLSVIPEQGTNGGYGYTKYAKYGYYKHTDENDKK